MSYTSDGRMLFPANYREWTYVTSGMDMSYTTTGAADHHMFDNVFVTPASYRNFLETGKWPDHTVFVLEVRGAQPGVSINQRGLTQSPEVMGYEVHVKDARLPGGFGFFEFDEKHEPAKIVARPASCYSCHEMHGAVDTTFVQFYPTLIGVARAKRTISPEFLKEISAGK
ncbi:MAG TPA: cytochrome P460 family protein [Candidatus Aquilonibacter sp.]|nr:cytochrome P460 family protein [Candidatus Aquilonibacter sp.]